MKFLFFFFLWHECLFLGENAFLHFINRICQQFLSSCLKDHLVGKDHPRVRIYQQHLPTELFYKSCFWLEWIKMLHTMQCKKIQKFCLHDICDKFDVLYVWMWSSFSRFNAFMTTFCSCFCCKKSHKCRAVVLWENGRVFLGAKPQLHSCHNLLFNFFNSKLHKIN